LFRRIESFKKKQRAAIKERFENDRNVRRKLVFHVRSRNKTSKFILSEPKERECSESENAKKQMKTMLTAILYAKCTIHHKFFDGKQM
jgi:hypothetical protein